MYKTLTISAFLCAIVIISANSSSPKLDQMNVFLNTLFNTEGEPLGKSEVEDLTYDIEKEYYRLPYTDAQFVAPHHEYSKLIRDVNEFVVNCAEKDLDIYIEAKSKLGDDFVSMAMMLKRALYRLRADCKEKFDYDLSAIEFNYKTPDEYERLLNLIDHQFKNPGFLVKNSERAKILMSDILLKYMPTIQSLNIEQTYSEKKNNILGSLKHDLSIICGQKEGQEKLTINLIFKYHIADPTSRYLEGSRGHFEAVLLRKILCYRLNEIDLDDLYEFKMAQIMSRADMTRAVLTENLTPDDIHLLLGAISRPDNYPGEIDSIQLDGFKQGAVKLRVPDKSSCQESELLFIGNNRLKTAQDRSFVDYYETYVPNFLQPCGDYLKSLAMSKRLENQDTILLTKLASSINIECQLNWNPTPRIDQTSLINEFAIYMKENYFNGLINTKIAMKNKIRRKLKGLRNVCLIFHHHYLYLLEEYIRIASSLDIESIGQLIELLDIDVKLIILHFELCRSLSMRSLRTESIYQRIVSKNNNNNNSNDIGTSSSNNNNNIDIDITNNNNNNQTRSGIELIKKAKQKILSCTRMMTRREEE